jgi:hypothetical protein
MLYNNPQILYQTADDDSLPPEAAITISTDNTGLIVLGQERDGIVVNRASARELAKVLITLSKG